MHILGVKPFARFLESKKLSAFRVEARKPQLLSRAPDVRNAHQASREKLKG